MIFKIVNAVNNMYIQYIFSPVYITDLNNPTIVLHIVKTIIVKGIIQIQFIDPITNKTITVPREGGNEFVIPSTGQVFIIYIDERGRTLFIFKGLESKPMDKGQ